MKELLKIKGVIPYIIVIFINAIVDLGDKILLQNTIFKVYDGSTQIALTALINALVLLPYVLLFTPAGFISDKFAKAKVLQYSSKVSLVLVVIVMISFYFGWFYFSLFMTFLLAAQSAFFSPAKYGYIKELFGKERLTEGNGVVQAVTIIAILLSSVLFSLFFESLIDSTETSPSQIMQNIWPITLILVALGIAQVIMTKKIPTILDGDSSLKFQKEKYFHFGYLKENIELIFKNRVILESIIGLALFFGIAQVVLAIFGVHLKEVANETNTVVAQGIMALSGIGIAIGSILTAKYSKHYIETGLIPIGTVGITAMIYLISKTSSQTFLGLEFLVFGIFGGFIIVILNALIQYRAKEHELGRVMAASNFVQNIVMLLFLSLTVFGALYALSTTSIFKFLIFIATISAIYTFLTLPQFFLRFLFKFIASFRYKLSTHGVENFPKDGGALLLGNHVSWIDWMVVAIASPRRINFVMERSIYEKWYFKWILQFFGVIPISSRGSKGAFKEIHQKLKEGKIVVLFPEGAITRNGHLGKFQRGFELITKDIDVPIIPFFIRGLWGSRFSYAEKKLKENVKKRVRDVGVSFGKPLPKDTKAPQLKKAIFELQIESWSAYIDTLPPLHYAWLKMASSLGEKLSVADATGTELSNHKLIAVSRTFADHIEKISTNEQNIGILMPASVGGTIINLATLMLGKSVVNLNYTANHESIQAAIKKARIKSIYTSKQFLSKLKAKGMDVEKSISIANIIFVEDLKKDIKKSDVIKKWALVKILPYFILEKLFLKKSLPDDTAAILFSSGSEGTPKGIELTHKNFMGNIKQFSNLLNFRDDDVIMATLPTFHVFGLTVATFTPLIEGIPFICQPDPTDAEGVGKLTAKYRGTLLFGTSTFFRIYTKNRKLLPLMFESIRHISAGAEKLSDDVRTGFKTKFGKEIYEGYGTTETTPAISTNIMDVLIPEYWHLQIGNKHGTIGMPVPGTLCKIVDPDTLEELPTGESGMIIVGGAQVMKGYLDDEKKTKEVIFEKDGIRWYITGDKGKIDEDGFITIVDRYSRFAKIAGEMISLGAVEEEIRKILPDEIDIVAANAPDSKKGEKIVLLYHGEINEEELKKIIRNSSLNPLMQPSSYHYLDQMPKLGSGKTDLKKAKKIAVELG